MPTVDVSAPLAGTDAPGDRNATSETAQTTTKPPQILTCFTLMNTPEL